MRYSRFEYDPATSAASRIAVGAERRASEVGVQQDAGRVHDPAQLLVPATRHARLGVGDDGVE